jgi:hypothetical protein
MSQSSDRIAVVVVHGMGNQFPMETLREFVEALQPADSVLYSSPNRVTSDREVRRLSISKQPFDYYEYYWAHQMEEPSIAKVLRWSFKLLFMQTPSASLKKHIGVVRLVVVLLPLLLLAAAGLGYWMFKDQINDFIKISVYGLSVLVVLRFIWSLISATLVGTIQSSVGDVIKYTIPSPDNIAVRDKIRKNGIELLRNLHEAKKADGVTPKYGKIILAGHSLGSIVAYDILSSLFAEYHGAYKNIPDHFKQNVLAALRNMYNDPDHTDNHYQNTQKNLFDEYQQLGNQWRVHQFITMGAPLTHASMILNKKPEDFVRKKNQREFPVSPPQLDHADNHFAFDHDFKTAGGNQVTIKMLHHAAHFAVTQWTNIYFKNDWVGGPVAPEFGKGVVDIEVVAKNKLLRTLPLSTHTKYWSTMDDTSLKILQQVLQRSLH